VSRFEHAGGFCDASRGRGAFRPGRCAALLALGTLLAGASLGPPSAGAAATTTTLGSSLPPTLVSQPVGGTIVATITQAVLPGRTLYAPFDGTITSWRMVGASGGPFSLQVLHRLPDGTVMSTGSAASGPLTGLGVLTFPASLRIREGDMIGLRNTAGTDTLGFSTGPPNLAFVWVPPLADGGAAMALAGTTAIEAGFNATELANCLVPKLSNKKLGAAKRALGKAGCTTGKVTRPKQKAARKRARFVRKQKPKAGKEVRGGTAVALTLGPKSTKAK
jgi:PASTA domain